MPRVTPDTIIDRMSEAPDRHLPVDPGLVAAALDDETADAVMAILAAPGDAPFPTVREVRRFLFDCRDQDAPVDLAAVLAFLVSDPNPVA